MRRSLPSSTYEQTLLDRADWSVSCQVETLCPYPTHPLWGIIAISGALMGSGRSKRVNLPIVIAPTAVLANSMDCPQTELAER